MYRRPEETIGEIQGEKYQVKTPRQGKEMPFFVRSQSSKYGWLQFLLIYKQLKINKLKNTE